MINEILKEFEEQFDHIICTQGGFIVGKKGGKFDNCASDLSYIPDWLKEKLTAFEQSIRAEDKKEYDLSEWRKVGVERGYWAYFQKEVKEDFLNDPRIQNILLQVQDGHISTGRAVELLRELKNAP